MHSQLVQGQERRDQQEGAEPAKQHADPADEAEMAESPVRGDHQHAEGDAGRGGGEQGGARRRFRALQARLAQAHSLPTQLFETREVDEPVVDAVAHHDGAEEGGLRVEVANHQAGEAEGDRDGHQHRQPEREDGARIAEEEEEGNQDQRDADQGGARHVVDDRLVLGDEEREGACESDAEVVAIELRLVPGDHRLHLVDHGARFRYP